MNYFSLTLSPATSALLERILRAADALEGGERSGYRAKIRGAILGTSEEGSPLPSHMREPTESALVSRVRTWVRWVPSMRDFVPELTAALRAAPQPTVRVHDVIQPPGVGGIDGRVEKVWSENGRTMVRANHRPGEGRNGRGQPFVVPVDGYLVIPHDAPRP